MPHIAGMNWYSEGSPKIVPRANVAANNPRKANATRAWLTGETCLAIARGKALACAYILNDIIAQYQRVDPINDKTIMLATSPGSDCDADVACVPTGFLLRRRLYRGN